MEKKEKLKEGNSLETKFWNDDIEVDENSPFVKYMNKIWNLKEADYTPTKEEREQLEKDMKEYFNDNTK